MIGRRFNHTIISDSISCTLGWVAGVIGRSGIVIIVFLDVNHQGMAGFGSSKLTASGTQPLPQMCLRSGASVYS